MTRADVHRNFTFDPVTRDPLEKLAREFADAVGQPAVAVVLGLGGLLDDNWRKINMLEPLLLVGFYTAEEFRALPPGSWTRIAGWNVVFFTMDTQVDYFLGKTLSCKDGKFFLVPQKPPPRRRTPVDMMLMASPNTQEPGAKPGSSHFAQASIFSRAAPGSSPR